MTVGWAIPYNSLSFYYDNILGLKNKYKVVDVRNIRYFHSM